MIGIVIENLVVGVVGAFAVGDGRRSAITAAKVEWLDGSEISLDVWREALDVCYQYGIVTGEEVQTFS